MTRLSVNINKIATLRNARGGSIPDVVEAAVNCQKYGAQGITVHPRPDERHITYQDVLDLRAVVHTEFNIEGYPDDRYMELVSRVKPEQATLVPDPPDALTSNAGWKVQEHMGFLKETIQKLQDLGIRTSLFIDTDPDNIRAAAETGTDRVELYTEPYAAGYATNREKAIAPFVAAARVAVEASLGLNAGHDLSLLNLGYFTERIPDLLEVSIGHALIADALYYGLENTIMMYRRLC